MMCLPQAPAICPRGQAYEPSLVDTLLNVLLAFVPIDWIDVRHTKTINASISAYSTAVGPSSLRRKFSIDRAIVRDSVCHALHFHYGQTREGTIRGKPACRPHSPNIARPSMQTANGLIACAATCARWRSNIVLTGQSSISPSPMRLWQSKKTPPEVARGRPPGAIAIQPRAARQAPRLRLKSRAS